MVQTLKIRPSSIINLNDDDYASFCFDEAISVLIAMLGNGKILKEEKRKEKNENNLISFLKEFNLEVK